MSESGSEICILLIDNKPLQKVVSIWSTHHELLKAVGEDGMINFKRLAQLTGLPEDTAEIAYFQALMSNMIEVDGTVDYHATEFLQAIVENIVNPPTKGRPRDG